MKNILRVFFLIILFYSCSPHYNAWKLSIIKADCPKASYAKIYLPASNTFNGLETEFVYSDGNLQLNLNIHSLQFPCDPTDSSITTVQITISENLYIYKANRLLGGQRLNLPFEACEQIMQALLTGIDVDIVVGRYETTLLANGFTVHYNSILHQVST